MQGSPDEIKTPTRGRLLAFGMIAVPLVLSPNSILPPPSSNCPFISAQTKSGLRFKHFYLTSIKFAQIRNCVTRDCVSSDVPVFRTQITCGESNKR